MESFGGSLEREEGVMLWVWAVGSFVLSSTPGFVQCGGEGFVEGAEAEEVGRGRGVQVAFKSCSNLRWKQFSWRGLCERSCEGQDGRH